LVHVLWWWICGLVMMCSVGDCLCVGIWGLGRCVFGWFIVWWVGSVLVLYFGFSCVVLLFFVLWCVV